MSNSMALVTHHFSYQPLTGQFLLAARTNKMNALAQVVSSCPVILGVAEFIHQLQRERGISNIFLVSKGDRFNAELKAQWQQTQIAEIQFRELVRTQCLVGSSALVPDKLLNKIALGLQASDHLGYLRQRVSELKMAGMESTQAYSRLIVCLLDVIFDMADMGAEPSITHRLITLFNVLQAKEYAGQERALGAIGFATTTFEKNLCEQVAHLQAAQKDRLALFVEHASPELIEQWKTLQSHHQDFDQIRQLITALASGPRVDSSLCEVWYELSTARIDDMHQLEQRITREIQQQTDALLIQAEQQVAETQAQLERLANTTSVTLGSWDRVANDSLLFDSRQPGLLVNSETNATFWHPSEAPSTSVYELLRNQASEMNELGEQLRQARHALAEQKRISRATLLLMQTRHLSEAEAYQQLQQYAMTQQRRLAEIADIVIATLHK